MIRLFVGLELSEEIRDSLSALSFGLPGVHWVPDDNLHLTLRFIGEVNKDEANDLHDALMALHAPAFTLSIAGTGFFETGGRPRTLYANVDRTDALVRLQSKIELTLVRAGCEHEGRKFKPHITLAQLKGAPMERLQPLLASLLREEMPVDHFTLFSSRLGSGDPIYTPEANYPLEPS